LLTPTVKPTITLPTTSFAACTSYAKVLSTCASATEFFYALNATAQASCACYSAPPQLCSSGTPVARQTTVATLAAGVFDNNAKACHDYFSEQGYENVAMVLSGALANGLCGKVEADLRKEQGNASMQGLSPILDVVVAGCQDGESEPDSGRRPSSSSPPNPQMTINQGPGKNELLWDNRFCMGAALIGLMFLCL
jgi:hypothetical protein